jgi:ATP-dependent DNA helicase RecQ
MTGHPSPHPWPGRQPTEILAEYWGFQTFRPKQEDVVGSLLSGRDTLAILPTGGGKSICFQVAGLCLEGLTLVVTPLIALMQDQLAHLRDRGIPAAGIHSGMDREEIVDVLRRASKGAFGFLYVSPERLETEVFLHFLPALPLVLVAVDEAHCISQWGYDFRPSYLGIARVRKAARRVPMVALTASATQAVAKDIVARLEMDEPAVFRQSFERPNLSYSVSRVESRSARLVEILRKVEGSAIVYCRTRRRTQEFQSMLQRNGISASFYHAGLDREERASRQEAWMRNETRVMVCTNAFGMGIDKPDVRLVVHTQPPECLENYYQEAGRAGRDGQRAYAVLLCQPSDEAELAGLPEERYPPMEVIRKVYQAMANYLQLPSGVGEDRSFPVDLQDLSLRFGLRIPETVHSLQAMQQAGILDYQESLFRPSTVVFRCGREDLEALYQVQPLLAPLTATLLRTYAGVFDHPTGVSENHLARAASMRPETAAAQLKTLHGLGIIEYRPRTESPHVRFLQNRVKAEDLYIEPLSYLARKKAFAERVKAMQDYISGNACRARHIGRYFGDDGIGECGICDACASIRRKREKGSRIDGRVEQRLEQLLREKPWRADELLQQAEGVSEDDLWGLLEAWQSEEKIVTTDQGLLKWTGKKKGPG